MAELPFNPELGEELLGLATIVLNAALMGVDETAVRPGATGELKIKRIINFEKFENEFNSSNLMAAWGGEVGGGDETTLTGDAGTFLKLMMALLLLEAEAGAEAVLLCVTIAEELGFIEVV